MWHDDFTKTRATNDTENCKFYCDQQYLQCCDQVWVPQFSISNILKISRVVSNMGGYKDLNNVTLGTSEWDLRLTATFSTELNFVNFPFDSQDLKIHFFIPQHANVYFQPITGLTSASNGANGYFQDTKKGASLAVEVVLTVPSLYATSQKVICKEINCKRLEKHPA